MGSLGKYKEKIMKYKILTFIPVMIKRMIKKYFFTVGKYLCRVDSGKIVFLTFSGRYECNPKWICEEMLHRNMPVKCIWGLPRGMKYEKNEFPKQVRPVYRNTVLFFWHLVTARVIIDNGIGTAYMGYRVKKSQCLIETWHGSLGIKRFDAETNKSEKWIRQATMEAEMTSYIISNSDFENDIYRNSFWKTTKIWKYGHARNDILVNKDSAYQKRLAQKIYEKYQIPFGYKICLYAPTFRDDKDLSPYKLDYTKLMHALSEKFGGEWVIASRFHSRVKELLSDYDFPEGVYNVSDYPDIQELLCIIDVGVTDYSSWICEYMLTRKPGFLFATDAREYEISNRAFFFPLTVLPFPVAKNEKELFDNIKFFDEDKYKSACDAFLREKGSIDDGCAAAKIVDAINDIL